jgi:dihydroorotase
VVVDPSQTITVKKENLLYKCGWSPFEGTTFSNKIDSTYINGRCVYRNDQIIEIGVGERLRFDRE